MLYRLTTVIFATLLVCGTYLASVECAKGEIIAIVQAQDNEVVGGESFSVDLFLDFEGSEAQLAVVAANAVGSPNISFVDFTAESPGIKTNEEGFNVALFYPFPDLLVGPGVEKILTLEFATSAVETDSIETIEFNLDNGGGFFFDRTSGIPSTENTFVEINLLAASVPEPSSIGLIGIGFGMLISRRKKKSISCS